MTLHDSGVLKAVSKKLQSSSAEGLSKLLLVLQATAQVGVQRLLGLDRAG